jgi:hypothetical protein
MKCMRPKYLCNFGAFHSTTLQLWDAPLCLTHLMHSILQLLRCQNSKTFSTPKPKPQLIWPNFRTKKMHKLHQLVLLGSWAPFDSFLWLKWKISNSSCNSPKNYLGFDNCNFSHTRFFANIEVHEPMNLSCEYHAFKWMKKLDWGIKSIHKNQWKKIEHWFFSFEDIQTLITSLL